MTTVFINFESNISSKQQLKGNSFTIYFEKVASEIKED